MKLETDFLVIGSGVAGLSFALKAAALGKVLVITKANKDESNTKYAQGGIAAVVSGLDTFDKHVADTLDAGDGLCNEEVVRMVVEQGPKRIQELIDYGADFDRSPDGTLNLGREGGHSEKRILHARDATGYEIEWTLLNAVQNHPNITINEHYFAIDLITQHHLGRYVNRGTPDLECYGVYALDISNQKVVPILSRATILASGGAGNVYAATTNPSVATGDGIAMVYRAMGRVGNMEFAQFHPTSFYDPGVRPAFLITEALRGAGAILRHSFDKKPFMHKYDERKDLAPRDIVARAIDNEMKISGTDFVYLDATHIDAKELETHFPTILERCLTKGIDIRKDYIPVVPAQHYTCGGVVVDKQGKTSINRLFACGEVSCSGLHGANRLASNSLLEGVVYAHNIFEAIQEVWQGYSIQENIPGWIDKGIAKTEEWVLISHNLQEVQSLMSNYVGIVRTDLRLERAMRRLNLIYDETEAFYRQTKVAPEICELRNIITCAYLTVKSAMIRKESRGLHYTTDYPDKLDRVYDTVL
ncbi:MAG: L-aspartate oxidase [Bacteroidia bacterium]|nr:L-aspartate oxidase [Bacteroidia bacterium]